MHFSYGKVTSIEMRFCEKIKFSFFFLLYSRGPPEALGPKIVVSSNICTICARSVWKKKTGLYTHHLTVINIIVILSVIIITNIIIIITASHPSRTCMILVTRYIYIYIWQARKNSQCGWLSP